LRSETHKIPSMHKKYLKQMQIFPYIGGGGGYFFFFAG
jgi:hypothetical protein